MARTSGCCVDDAAFDGVEEDCAGEDGAEDVSRGSGGGWDDGDGAGHAVTAASEVWSLLGLAGPMALTLLCRFVQGFTDLAVVGHYLGSDALAAVSLALTVRSEVTGDPVLFC
jgi:hypothetical protein